MSRGLLVYAIFENDLHLSNARYSLRGSVSTVVSSYTSKSLPQVSRIPHRGPLTLWLQWAYASDHNVRLVWCTRYKFDAWKWRIYLTVLEFGTQLAVETSRDHRWRLAGLSQEHWTVQRLYITSLALIGSLRLARLDSSLNDKLA